MQFEHYKSGETPVPLRKRPNSWGTMFPKNTGNGNGNNKEDEESKAQKRLIKRSVSSNIEYRIRQKNNESIRMITELGMNNMLPSYLITSLVGIYPTKHDKFFSLFSTFHYCFHLLDSHVCIFNELTNKSLCWSTSFPCTSRWFPEDKIVNKFITPPTMPRKLQSFQLDGSSKLWEISVHITVGDVFQLTFRVDLRSLVYTPSNFLALFL